MVRCIHCGKQMFPASLEGKYIPFEVVLHCAVNNLPLAAEFYECPSKKGRAWVVPAAHGLKRFVIKRAFNKPITDI